MFFYRKERKELRKVRKVFLRQSFVNFAFYTKTLKQKNFALFAVKIMFKVKQPETKKT